jgi:MFS transporter, PPP family, 3-phenylpropionic acid transporter
MINGLSSRWILGAQYFLYFGGMGVYLPFFNLYCYRLGFSGFQIGTLSAVRSLVLILFTIVWGLLADRFHARRRIYIACNFAGAFAWGFFMLTENFVWMLLITAVHAIFYAPLIAFLEAFAMQVLGKDKKRYGRMRAWGSLAFIVTVLVLGRLVELYTIKIILSLFLAGAWAQALTALTIPRLPGPNHKAFGKGLRSLLLPRVLVFWACGFLMLLSHGAYYAFFSIHLTALGYDEVFIALCWAVAVGAEITAMLFSERIFRHLRYETVLSLSFAAAVARWAGLWIFSAAPALLLLQVTHALSYGTFHMASILYMDSLSPAEAKTTGQAANNAVSYGLGLMVGFILSGWLYSHIGSAALFAVSGIMALVGGIIFVTFTLKGQARLSLGPKGFKF